MDQLPPRILELAVADRPASTHALPERDGLERLLETERRLAARLAVAETEAREIRQAADRRASELAGLDGTDLEDALAELAQRIAEARDAECRAATAQADLTRARYSGLDGDRLEAAAAAVLRALRGDTASVP